MDISAFFKSLADSDIAPIVICNFENTIIYMNPTAISRYEKWGGEKLVGKSIFCCHNDDSNKGTSKNLPHGRLPMTHIIYCVDKPCNTQSITAVCRLVTEYVSYTEFCSCSGF